jgi:hypothetical protein
LQDFVWWSGLPIIDAKHALDMLKADLVSETIDSLTYWFTKISSIKKTDTESVYLLPAYDEFLIRNHEDPDRKRSGKIYTLFS